MNTNNTKLAIIGMGYVGLPLALEFGKKINSVIGFDIDKLRIKELNNFFDKTGEASSIEIKKSVNLEFTSDLKDIRKCNCYIIAVPTPVNKKNIPDLRILLNASKLVAKVLKKKDIVIFESTVYPGATEEECIPVLEKFSNLIFNKDFYVGYSPERINPGDKKHTVKNIIKVVSGSTKKTLSFVEKLYSTIVEAGTHKASSIKIAEAAKIIENTQRDLNIALINELSIIFNKLNLDTEEILKAAETKWNFNSFRPGLVGGHCIGVDPYYLTYKSSKIGYTPKIILAGRKVNDGMARYVFNKIINLLEKKYKKKYNVLVMGLSFKEDCADTRNSKVLDICKFFLKKKINLDCYDPIINKKQKDLSFLNIVQYPRLKYYDCILIATKHKFFKKLGLKKIKSFCEKSGFIYDLKFLGRAKKNYYRL